MSHSVHSISLPCVILSPRAWSGRSDIWHLPLQKEHTLFSCSGWSLLGKMIMNELANGWLHVYGQRTEGEIDGDRRHIKTMKHDPYNEVNQNSVDDLLQTPNFRNRLSLIEGGTSLRQCLSGLFKDTVMTWDRRRRGKGCCVTQRMRLNGCGVCIGWLMMVTCPSLIICYQDQEFSG